MKYIYSAVFVHESNTSSPHISDLAWYKGRCWELGENVDTFFRGTKTEYGGFIDALAQDDDVVLIPIIAAEAMPSGPVATEVVEIVTERILTALGQAKQVDGVLLSLHGAMVTETSEDGEGDLARAIRAVVGDDIPIYATLDLHANVTDKMLRHIDILIPYDCYPHIDRYECGFEAGDMLIRALRGELRPRMSAVKLPLLFPLTQTFSGPMVAVNRLFAELEAEDGVLDVSLAHGFTGSDIYEVGVSVIAITDGDKQQADRVANLAARFIWERRETFFFDYLSVEEAAARCRLHAGGSGPLVIADGPDNPGGGSSADGTHMLRAMLEGGVTDALVVMICDEESTERCFAAGEGAWVDLVLGGNMMPELLGEPLPCRAKVLQLTDGKYRNLGPMSGGVRIDLMGTALIDVAGIRVILSKNTTQPYDLALLHLHGIDPKAERVIVVKSAVHFRAAYEPVADQILVLAYPGLCAQRPQDGPTTRCRRPVYPLDMDTQW